MTETTEIRTTLVIDKGQVWDAARILVEDTTLREHVNAAESAWTVLVGHRSNGVPYELWGSGTQALWRLLSAMVTVSERVSLYEVFSHLDRDNTRAAVAAVAVLAGVER